MTKIIQTEDGSHSLLSSQFDVSYHSIHGAIQEAQTVFIDAALHYFMPQQKALSILEIGFGTGLNAFMTYLEANALGLDLTYVGVEAFPIDLALAEQLNYPSLLGAEGERERFLDLHRSGNEFIRLSPHFNFCRQLEHFQNIQSIEAFDIIYYDAFAPNAQPELWEAPLLEKMYRALKPNGVLTTYCAKGVVKRCLKSIGFTVEGIPGPIGKREMTRAIKQ